MVKIGHKDQEVMEADFLRSGVTLENVDVCKNGKVPRKFGHFYYFICRGGWKREYAFGHQVKQFTRSIST